MERNPRLNKSESGGSEDELSPKYDKDMDAAIIAGRFSHYLSRAPFFEPCSEVKGPDLPETKKPLRNFLLLKIRRFFRRTLIHIFILV